jgi:Flp pilus assembly protein TadG
MKSNRSFERGQALILIVFGLAGLIAAAAVAVDGGNVYSDRRHAQNAADTAVMATGLKWIRDSSDWSAAQAEGFIRATDNGYDDNGTTNTVEIYRCTDAGANCNLQSSEPFTDTSPYNGQWDPGEPYVDRNGNGQYDLVDPSQYLETRITSHVSMYLARVVGVGEVTNVVQALAKAIPSGPTTWFGGKALVSLQPNCKGEGGSTDYPFQFGGDATVDIGTSGIFVNSDCTTSNAFDDAGNSNTMTLPSGKVCVVGLADPGADGINPPPESNCGTQVDSQFYQAPPVDSSSCPTAGTTTTVSGVYFASPGTYNVPFPTPPTAGPMKLLPGIYCLNAGFSVTASGWDISSDMDSNGTFDGSDGANEGVLFYVPTAGVTINGGELHLGAMNNPATNPAIKGFLFILPATNHSAVNLSGNNGSVYIGTIYAPGSQVTLNGTQDTDGVIDFDTQVIAYSIKITGSNYMNINYYSSKTGRAITNPVLQLYR